MIFKQNNFEIQTNLEGKSYNQLLNGKWKLGFISDNQGLEDENNDYYYHTVKININNKDVAYRSFKNKVNVKLIDGSIVNQHIIHWVKSKGYFCITTDPFWDQFE